MKIAVLNRIFSKKAGGAERYSVSLVEELSAKHEIHVFAQDIDHHWPGVSYHRVSAPLRRSRWLNQLWYAVATWWHTRSGFDVVHSHENTWHGNVQTVHVLPIKHNLFSGKTGLQKAATWLKVITSPRLLAYLSLEKARFSYHEYRQIVVTSPSLKGIFGASYPGNHNAVSVVTPGVSVPNLKFDKVEAKRRLGVPIDGFTLAFVGNRYDIKGLPTLLLALQSLPLHVNLLVVGNNEQIDIYQAQAKKLGVLQRVQFLGAIDSVELVYQASDALAHPTLEDTFAMVVLEAMSYGLPVVVSCEQYCGIAGLLADGLNTLLLNEPKDSESLVLTIQKLLRHEQLRNNLSKEALKFSADYSWSKIARAQEQIYLRITSKT